MSSCNVEVILDASEPAYEAGAEITGRVIVRASKDVEPKALVIEQLWRAHGRGNTHEEVLAVQREPGGLWRADTVTEVPFRFVCPSRPVTYHGHYINVDHYVKARVDVAWATDPRGETDYVVIPGASTVKDYIAAVARKDEVKPQQAGGCGKVVGYILLPVLIPLLLVLLLMLLPILLVAGTVMFVRHQLARRRVGDVVVEIGAPAIEELGKKSKLAQKLTLSPTGLKGSTHVVGSGAAIPVRVRFTPRIAVSVNGVRVKVTAQEIATSGSGTNATTHRHTVWEEVVPLVDAGVLAAGEPVDLAAEVTLPESDAASLDAPSNKIEWKAVVQIDIPGWPDWTSEHGLLMVPSP
jgi:hypothetical protein